MTNIGIFGHGVVGQATEQGFKDPKNQILVYDKFKQSHSLQKVVEDSSLIFICLPTPYKDNKIDLSIIDENLEEISKIAKNKIIIIKSSVIPGTTKKYQEKYKHLDFAFNPEFLTEVNAFKDFINADRIIISSFKEEVTNKIKELYKQKFPKIPTFISTPTEAEMTKYMSNTFLATKVIFANEIFELCEKLDISYNKVKEMVTADKRIGETHLNVSDERGFGGKCFPKDIVALIGLYKELELTPELLNTVWNKNLKIRKVKDWESIPFAKSM